MPEKTIWGIHGGKTGDADSLFLKKDLIAIGWDAIGDLSRLRPDREAFKAAVAKGYPHSKAGAIPNNAGQLFRFVHEMKAVISWLTHPNVIARYISVASKAITSLIRPAKMVIQIVAPLSGYARCHEPSLHKVRYTNWDRQ